MFCLLASLYNLVNKANLVHNLFLVYLSISACYGRLCAHHQEKQLCLCDTWYLLFCVDGCLVCRVHTRQSSIWLYLQNEFNLLYFGTPKEWHRDPRFRNGHRRHSGDIGIRRSVEEVSPLGNTRLSANFSAYLHPALISDKVIYFGYWNNRFTVDNGPF